MRATQWMATLLFAGLMIESQSVLAQQAITNNVPAPLAATGLTLPAAGEVEQAVGLVKAISIDNKERILKDKSPVFPKDFIVTAKDSYAGMRFTDGTLIVLRPLSVIQINQYQFADSQVKNNNIFKLNLDAGGIGLSPGVIARTSFGSFLIETPISEIIPAGQKALIAFAPNMGAAFMGMGRIRTNKGTKNMLQPSAITIDWKTLLPVQVSVTPALLSGNTEMTAEQYLKTAMTTHGEAAAFNSTAVYNAAITPAQLSENAVVASLNVDDAGNVTVAQTSANTIDDGEDDISDRGDYAEPSNDDDEAW